MGMGMMLFMVAIVGLVVWGIARFSNDRRDRPDTDETSTVILEKVMGGLYQNGGLERSASLESGGRVPIHGALRSGVSMRR